MLDAARDLLASQFALSVVFIAAAVVVMLTAVAYCIYFERKIAAWIQDRYGPNRVGPLGLLQPLADGLKFVLKEDINPGRVDRPLFMLAPMLAFIVAMIGFVVIPFGGPLRWPWMSPDETLLVQGASIDLGILYLLAVGSMGVYGVVIGGWASNNKFSFYGGMRAAAQMLSYEIPLGLALLVVILTTGELRLERMVTAQIDTTWNALLHPVAFVILLVAVLAETNRTPFDLTEAEQELIGGYHTEYSAMKFALFFLGEYAHIITVCGLMAVLFFGGWELVPFSRGLRDVPGLSWVWWITSSTSPWAALLRVGVTCVKIAGFVFLFMWIRWTLPRFRFDQLMRLAWKGLVPLGMVLVAVQGGLVYIGRPVHWSAPLCEIAALLSAGLIGAWSGRPVTGRQASMLDRVAWPPP
jgi:NADH-quinone oxidoreductase subunit H